MIGNPNPYQPPRTELENEPKLYASHYWNGRRFDVSAKKFWLDESFTVAIDGQEVHHQPYFRIDSSFRFRFRHQGSTCQAKLTPLPGLNLRAVNYELFVENRSLGKSKVLFHRSERRIPWTWKIVVLGVLLGLGILWIASRESG